MGTGRHRVRMRVWIVCLLLGLVIGSLNARSTSDDSDESDESSESTDDGDQLAEVTLAVTLEEQVASLRNGTQTNNRTLSRLEAFYEELERRILRLEAANNGTRDVPESVDESLTSPAPETTTYTPCCRKIKLKSRGSMTRYRASDASLESMYWMKARRQDLPTGRSLDLILDRRQSSPTGVARTHCSVSIRKRTSRDAEILSSGSSQDSVDPVSLVPHSSLSPTTMG